MGDNGKGKDRDKEKLSDRIAESTRSLASGISSGSSTTSALSSLLANDQKTARHASLDGQDVNWGAVFDEAAVSTGTTSNSQQPQRQTASFRNAVAAPTLNNEYEQFARRDVSGVTALGYMDQQPRDGQAVVDMLNDPDFNDIIDSADLVAPEPSSRRLVRTIQRSGDTGLLVSSETTPYFYGLMQADGEALSSYLRNNTYTDDVWTLPSQVRSLVEEARQEVMTDQQPVALQRLQMLQGHLKQNHMQLSQEDMEDIWKSF